MTRSSRAAPGAGAPLGERRGVRVVLERRPAAPSRCRHPVARAATSCERDVHGRRPTRPVRWSIARRHAEADRGDLRRRAAPSTAASSSSSSAVLGVRRRRRARAVGATSPVARRRRRRGSSSRRRRRRSTRVVGHARRVPYPAGWPPRREAVPRLPRRPRQGQGPDAARDRAAAAARRRPRAAATSALPRLRRRSRRAVARRCAGGAGSPIALVLVVVLLARLGASPATSRSAAASRRRTSACRRAPTARSTPQNGLLLSHPTTILLLGTDHSPNGRRAAPTSTPTRSCSSAPTRTHHRLVYLSIPRDLRVDDPRPRADRRSTRPIQIGGPQLAIQTVRELHRPADQPRRRRRLRRLQGADRQARRHRRSTSRSRSSRTSSTARTRRRRAASSGRAGASRRACST